MSQSPDNLNDDLEPDDNIDDWLRRNCPEAYTIARRHPALKRSYTKLKLNEHSRYINKLKDREEQLYDLEEKLYEQEPNVAEFRAKLRSWEREESKSIPISIAIPFVKFAFSTSIPLPSLRFINNLFEWLLKAGLSVVPFLGLLSIVGAKLDIASGITSTASNKSANQVVVFCIVFSAVALTWMISTYVCNLILSQEAISQEEQELRENYQKEHPYKALLKELFIYNPIFFLIWLSEALVGIATIPSLIGNARLSAANAAATTAALKGETITNLATQAKWTAYVEWYEYLEIGIGIGLFALVNILAAIAKARRYRYIIKDKIELGRAIAERDYTKNRINELRNEISAIETKIADLERKIENPEFALENVFNRSITDLSTLYMQGRDIDGIKPSDPDLSDDEDLDENTTYR